jgi:hypothetical protein
MSEGKCKFGIKVDKINKGMWSICFGISHFFSETYLFINLVKWSISIGWLETYEEENK